MSTSPESQVNQEMVEQARRQVNRLAEEIAHLSEMEMEPPEYYGEFLQRVLAALAAPAGAVWIRTPQGNLQLQYQIRMREVGLEQVENGRVIHDELLRQAVMKGQPALLAPHSGLGQPEDGGKVAAGNPTNFVVLIAPILVDRQVAGLVEVWQDPHRGPDAQRGFLQFVVRMASLASSYTRNHQLRQMSTQQQVWTQLEAFAKSVHSSLNPVEVAYLVANDGRRLIECDRVSVGLREGGKAVVRAISGADVVERRSNLVVLMRALFDAVLKWDEKLVYNGSKDDSLPPKVLHALDNYLEESNSKFLVVTPLRDTREKDSKRPARSIMMMEAFEPTVAPEQLSARMEVVAKHATSALYNAWEYRKIPFRFFWLPLAKVQEGLGGKAKAIVLLVTFAVVLLIASMILVPYPLKMDATGKLQPQKMAWIYAPLPGHVMEIKPDNLASGDRLSQNQDVILLHSSELEGKIRELRNAVKLAEDEITALTHQLNFQGQNLDEATRAELHAKLAQAAATQRARSDELEDLRRRTNADTNRPGYFWLRPPMAGQLLTSDFRTTLLNRHVQPNEPLLQVGDVPPGEPDGKTWEIELKIPQRHIGQILASYQTNNPKEALDVDFIVRSEPTATYKGKLPRENIAVEAVPDRTDNNEAESVIIARVKVVDDEIPEGWALPSRLLSTAGTEVGARVRCGNRPMGYSLFYGVWEFFYEKVVFFF